MTVSNDPMSLAIGISVLKFSKQCYFQKCSIFLASVTLLSVFSPRSFMPSLITRPPFLVRRRRNERRGRWSSRFGEFGQANLQLIHASSKTGTDLFFCGLQFLVQSHRRGRLNNRTPTIQKRFLSLLWSELLSDPFEWSSSWRLSKNRKEFFFTKKK